MGSVDNITSLGGFELGRVHCIDCLEAMKRLPDKCVDLVITSPPYDNLRDYNGYSFDFEGIAVELFKIIKDGGVVVWVVGDATVNGSETGTSFRQALYFKEIGFNLHDTMIHTKPNCPFPANVRYNQQFEYMFVFSKGKPKTFKPIKEPKSEKEIKKIIGKQINFNSKSFRNKDGSTTRADSDVRMLERLKNAGSSVKKTMGNVWVYPSGYMVSSKDTEVFQHPAVFPEHLAHDHVVSWSNSGDIIIDTFAGSGTVGYACIKTGRQFLGFELDPEYCKLANNRIQATEKGISLKEFRQGQQTLF